MTVALTALLADGPECRGPKSWRLVLSVLSGWCVCRDKTKAGPVAMSHSSTTFLTCYEACGSPDNYEGVRFVWISNGANSAGSFTLNNISVVSAVR